jgi:hypothetical protein
MPSEFPRSPKLLKGALVIFETRLPVPTNFIIFQYNPSSMNRTFMQFASTIDPRMGAGDTQYITLPPLESFQASVELDATDQLEAPGSNPLAVAVGLHPALAALEMLISPPSTALILNKVLALAGSSIISPAQIPLVLFVWGPARVVPVRVMSVSIVEEAFDTLLNPIRAKVSLEMRSLSLIELFAAGPPFDTLGIVNLVAKEVLARANAVNSAVQIGANLSF